MMERLGRACAVCVFSLLSSTTLAKAGPSEPAGPTLAPTELVGHGYLSIGAENDAFGNGADHDYTHGTDIQYFSEPCALDWVRRTAQALWLAPRDVDCNRTRV